MPTYEYKCLKCGEEFEKLQPPKAEAPKCLECGHPETQKLLSAPSIIFKGSGFYKTDSESTRSPSSTPSSTKESKDNKKESTDNKAAPITDAKSKKSDSNKSKP